MHSLFLAAPGLFLETPVELCVLLPAPIASNLTAHLGGRLCVLLVSVRSHLWSCMWSTDLGRIASLACSLGFVNGPCWWSPCLVPLTMTHFEIACGTREASGICLQGGCQPFSWLSWRVSPPGCAWEDCDVYMIV